MKRSPSSWDSKSTRLSFLWMWRSLPGLCQTPAKFLFPGINVSTTSKIRSILKDVGPHLESPHRILACAASNPFGALAGMFAAARVAAALLLCGVALADLPVHCVHRDVSFQLCRLPTCIFTQARCFTAQILGKWTFHLGDNDGDASATCGHHVPDRILTMVKHYSGPSNPPFKVGRCSACRSLAYLAATPAPSLGRLPVSSTLS